MCSLSLSPSLFSYRPFPLACFPYGVAPLGPDSSKQERPPQKATQTNFSSIVNTQLKYNIGHILCASTLRLPLLFGTSVDVCIKRVKKLDINY